MSFDLVFFSRVLDYAAKQAHVELAERMRKRDAGESLVSHPVFVFFNTHALYTHRFCPRIGGSSSLCHHQGNQR